MCEIIHHYTDINTLALILKNKTIRFNRLDRVDDITEGESFQELDLEQFYFVSCWTHDENESIPQWNMYTTDMAGVRISFPKELFNYKEMEVSDQYKGIQRGKIYSPISFDEMFTDDYMVLPMAINYDNFAKKVKYDPDYKQKKNNAINVDIKNGQFKGQINDLPGIASLKSPDWSFQKEFRFVLFILPSIQLPENGPFAKEFSDRMPSFVAQKLYNGEGPEIDYFDLEIDPHVLDNIKITTGPLITEGDKLIVDSLLSSYTSNGTMRESQFEGTIRTPSR